MQKIAKIITVASQKGGVGKTTTAINLSASLAELGNKVLLIDLDPQGNATLGLGFSLNDFEFNTYHILTKAKNFNELSIKINENFYLAPANISLIGVEKYMQNSNLILKEEIEKILFSYDYIIIDSSPSLSSLTINALSASSSVLLPLQCEFFALEALLLILNTIDLVKETSNPKLEIEGFLPTMYNKNYNILRDNLSNIEARFAKQLFYFENEVLSIPRSVKVTEALSYGKPLNIYAKNSPAALAYKNLALLLSKKYF